MLGSGWDDELVSLMMSMVDEHGRAGVTSMMPQLKMKYYSQFE